MGSFLVGLTALALVAAIGAHMTLLVRLAMNRPRYLALVALAVPPLAPYWGWRQGVRRPIYVWGAAVALYALGVAILAR
jgi:hypothetical protein